MIHVYHVYGTSLPYHFPLSIKSVHGYVLDAPLIFTVIQNCGTTFEYKKYSFIACSWRRTQANLKIQAGIPSLVKATTHCQISLSCCIYNSQFDA